MDKVTVIVPVYNTERFIRECVDSILAQTYTNLEVILVDDGSPDRCPEICDDYGAKDARVKVIHKKNEGLGIVRNTGIAAATGRYITFVDSDDWIAKDHIQNLVCGIQGCQLAVGSHTECDESGSPFRVLKVPKSGETDTASLALNMIAPGGKANTELAVAMSVCFNLYDLDIIKANRLSFYSERETVGEDLFFNLDYVLLCDKVNFIEEYGYYYRQFHNSISHKYRPERIARTEAYYEKLTAAVTKHGLLPCEDHRIARSTLTKFRVALKNLCKSGLPFQEKVKHTKDILNNGVLQECLASFPPRNYRLVLRITTWLMKRKMALLTVLVFRAR